MTVAWEVNRDLATSDGIASQAATALRLHHAQGSRTSIEFNYPDDIKTQPTELARRHLIQPSKERIMALFGIHNPFATKTDTGSGNSTTTAPVRESGSSRRRASEGDLSNFGGPEGGKRPRSNGFIKTGVDAALAAGSSGAQAFFSGGNPLAAAVAGGESSLASTAGTDALSRQFDGGGGTDMQTMMATQKQMANQNVAMQMFGLQQSQDATRLANFSSQVETMNHSAVANTKMIKEEMEGIADSNAKEGTSIKQLISS